MSDCSRNSRELQGLGKRGEHLGQPKCQSMSRRIQAPNITPGSVRVWEIQIAWATYSRDCA